MEIEVFEAERNGTLDVQERSRLGTLIQYARTDPRTIESFRARVLDLCTLNEAVAEQCLYALPRTKRDGEKVKIEGPSIRMAEIVLKSWKHAAVFGRLVDSGADYVVAQATAIDFEDLTMVSKEHRRKVQGSHGDARSLAENAAISIASRNAIFALIPRALWQEAYDRAKDVAAGTLDTLEKRRGEAIAFLLEQKVSEARVFAAIDVAGINDIGLEELAHLRTLVRQVRAGEMTMANAFPDPDRAEPERETSAKGVKAVKEKLGAGKDAGPSNSAA